MKTKHRFDFVHDAQETFRILLNAMANPGRPETFGTYAAKFTEHGEWLALAMTLLDGEVTYYSDFDEGLKKEIHFLTGAREALPEEADFIFLEDCKTPGAILEKAKGGTYEEPHKSAMIVVKSKEEPEEAIRLEGPGVPPEGREMETGQMERDWIDARDQREYEYPRGVELLFLRPGCRIVAVTRKIKVQEEKGNEV